MMIELIGVEEIRAIRKHQSSLDPAWSADRENAMIKAGAQTQLEADKEAIQEIKQEIFDEIETYIHELRLWSIDSTNFNSKVLSFIYEIESNNGEWQALKKRLGVK